MCTLCLLLRDCLRYGGLPGPLLRGEVDILLAGEYHARTLGSLEERGYDAREFGHWIGISRMEAVLRIEHAAHRQSCTAALSVIVTDTVVEEVAVIDGDKRLCWASRRLLERTGKVVAIKESQLGVGSVLAHGLCLPPLCLLPTALISLHDNLHDLSLLRATQTTLRCITDNNHPTLYPFKHSHKSKSSQMQSHILLHSLLVFIFNADLVSAQAPSLPRYVFSAIYAFHNLKIQYRYPRSCK